MPFVNIPKQPSLTFKELVSLDQLFCRPVLDPRQSSTESRFLEEFDHVALLSKGAFGHVYEAQKKMEKKRFAVKCIKLSANDEEMAQVSAREVEVLSGLKHRNIVFYYNAWWEKQPPPGEDATEEINEDDEFSSYSDAFSFDSRRIKEAEELYGNVSVTSSRSEQLPSLEKRQTSVGLFSTGTSDESYSRPSSFSFLPFNLPICHFAIPSLAAQMLTHKTNDSFIYLYIQMELCRQENLANWLKTRQPVELNIFQMYREILSAVKYLHGQDLVHRDLKPNNIFFDFDWSIKVGDFGLSKRITADEGLSLKTSSRVKRKESCDHTLYIGTKPYMAPEQETTNNYNHKVDVYALAVILFELLMGPFKTDSERVDCISRLKSFQPLPKLQEQPANIKQLINNMLSSDADKRPEVKDILSEYFPKEGLKQPNRRPVVKRRNSRPSVQTPIRHAGDVFQSKLLMLFLIRGIRKGYQFQLGTEMYQLGGIFDNLIFKYQVNICANDWSYRLLQAKYKQDEAFKISAIQLLSDNLGDFSLAKYFRSYIQIKRTGEDIKDCIICTNVGFDVNSLMKGGIGLVPASPAEDILTFENISKNNKRPACYKLQITNVLQQKLATSSFWSDVYLLADKLREYAKSNKPIALHQDVLKRYHVALVNERVIDLTTKKFHQDFVCSFNLSAGATQLREIICNLKGGENDLKNWRFKLSNKFGKTTTLVNKPVDLLPERVTDDDIADFFDKLVFAVDTPNVVKLDQILIAEVGQHFKVLGLDMLQRVWELTYKKFLSSQDGAKILEETEQAMVSINLRAISDDYQHHLRNIHFQYELKDIKKVIKELKKFLCQYKNNIHILSISSTSPGSTAVKVFSALETLRDFENEDSYLVVSSDRLIIANKLDQWKKTLELGPSKLLVIVCEKDVGFITDIYNQLDSALTKRVIIISRTSDNENTQPPERIWKEIEDCPSSAFECLQINVKQTCPEELRNTLVGMLSDPCNRNTAVVFVQGIIQGDVTSLKRFAPQNYKLIHNQTEEQVEGFAAIVVHRSLDFHRILPSRFSFDTKWVAGVGLSSFSLYSVYHNANDANNDFNLQSNASNKTVICASPFAVSPIAEKEVECKCVHWPEGDNIRHGAGVHIGNLDRLQLTDGNQYIRFSILPCCCFQV